MLRDEVGSGLRPLSDLPAPRLGIIGGGQLAKMTASAASELGCEVVILERAADFPAQSLDTHTIIGDWDRPEDLARLAGLVDVVTLENEFIPSEALLTIERLGKPLWPSARTMSIVQDKLEQKRAFEVAGLPVVRFAAVDSIDSIRAFGLPAVLKRRRNGYDGKGNASVGSAADLVGAWARLDGDHHALYVEEFCPFVREVAIIVTRSQSGEVAVYPLVETVNHHHICHEVTVPAAVAPSVAEAAADLARRALETIGGVGTFGMEFFLLADNELLINEIAPRVHNTGHYTIEASHCSQFENHVRAVLGWPLGSPKLVAKAAAMVNLLGEADGKGAPHGMKDALAVPGAHVHVYGKTRSAKGRKMGHVTALGSTPAEALATARAAARHIRFGDRT